MMGSDEFVPQADAIVAAGIDLKTVGDGRSLERCYGSLNDGSVTFEFYGQDLPFSGVSESLGVIKAHVLFGGINLHHESPEETCAQNAVAMAAPPPCFTRQRCNTTRFISDSSKIEHCPAIC